MKTVVVGLTGQTGAGKSTVAACLREKGFPVIDGDSIAREVTETDSPVLQALAEEFGADIRNDDGSLNRALLASRAFANRENTDRLNRITHPAITGKVRDLIGEAEQAGAPAVIIDAAALLESDAVELCRIIAVVTAPEDIRLKRIMERDGLSRETALKRINAQHSEEYYHNKADIIVYNYPPFLLNEEVEKLINAIHVYCITYGGKGNER